MERVIDFLEEYFQEGRQAFVKKHSRPFLVYPEKASAARFSTYHTRMADRKEGAYVSGSAQDIKTFLVLPLNAQAAGAASGKFTIGRAPEREFTIDHSTVSKRHAYLAHDPEKNNWKLGDVGSTNGTFVNGHPIESASPVFLRDGQVVSFGDCDFLFFSPEGFVELLERVRQEK